MNNDRLARVDQFLKSCAYYLSTNQLTRREDVYGMLTNFGLSPEETRCNLRPNFYTWLEKFKNIKNIRILYSSNWPHFFQMFNDPNQVISMQRDSVDPIKMYITVRPDHLDKTVELLLKFLAKNKIVHTSKIADTIRTDMIVLRVATKEEAIKVAEFIRTNKYIVEGQNEPSPFCFNENKIGYALDFLLSYNSEVTKYIYEYLMHKKGQNELHNVSYADFYRYLQTSYQKTFSTKEGIENLERKRDIGHATEHQILNYQQILELIILSLNPNAQMEDYYQYVEAKNNLYLRKNAIERIGNIRSEQRFTMDQLQLMEKYFLMTLSKYPAQAVEYLATYIKYGNINGVTRTGGLRDVVKNNLPPDTIKEILSSYHLTLEQYTEQMRIKLGIKINVLNNASTLTFQKYGYEQLYRALISATNGNYNGFTRENNARANLTANVGMTEITNVIVYSLLSSGYSLEEDDLISEYTNYISSQPTRTPKNH